MDKKPDFNKFWKLGISLVFTFILGVIMQILGLLEGYCTPLRIHCGLFYALMLSLAFLLLLGIVNISWNLTAKLISKTREVKNTESKPHNEDKRIGIKIYNPNKDKITNVNVELLSLISIGRARKDTPVPIPESDKFFSDKKSEIEKNAIIYLAEIRNDSIFFMLNEPYDGGYFRRFFSQKVTGLEGKEASMSTFRIKIKITATAKHGTTEEIFEDLIRFRTSSTYMKSIDKYYIVSAIFIGNKIMEDRGLITYVKKEPT